MQHSEFEAPEVLQNVVKCFWYNCWDYSENLTAFEVMPDGYAEIIFHFGQQCNVLKDNELKPLPSPFIMGIQNKPVTFYSNGKLEILAVRCFPWTVFDLLNLPPGKQGIYLFEHPLAGLQKPLADLVASGQIRKGFNYLSGFIVNLYQQPDTDNTVAKAGSAMLASNGTIPVSDVATAAHATVRTLERKFKRSSGYSVKDVAALMRFEQVRNFLWQNPEINLAALAQQFGYADQSHLSREFKRYTSTTPAAFAKKAREKIDWLDFDDVY